MVPSIGIVGCGVAGLHLGLLLRQHDISVTLYGDKTADQIAGGRLPNTVAHHDTTLERERRLGVCDHWDPAEYGYVCHHHYIGGPEPLVFRGDFTAPSRAVDYRLYLPALLADFQDRGGRFEVRSVQAADIEELSRRHDLIVIAAGRGSLGDMFPRRADKSPYDTPQRKLCVGLYHGVAPSEPKGVTISVAPGQGELLEIPIYSFDGHVTALLFENVPGGDLESLASERYDDDPAAFEKLVLTKLRQHHPKTFERVEPNELGLTRPEDLLQGALVPTVRDDYVRLPGGTFAICVGDVHTLVDPMMGQGANSASYSAWVLGEAIIEDLGLDERLCHKVATRRSDRVMSISDWTNFMLQVPPAPHLLKLFGAMAHSKSAADAFTNNFNEPERQWDILATPERTHTFLAAHGATD
ncbi:MAG: styrene monooxygenase subunit StyA [Nocardioidaceae bacterium]